MPQARLGGGIVREEQHHITGPGKLLSRELLQQFVCSYTQMSYGHTKGGKTGDARHESCSIRRYHQERLTLLEVKAPTNTQLNKKEKSGNSVHSIWKLISPGRERNHTCKYMCEVILELLSKK